MKDMEPDKPAQQVLELHLACTFIELRKGIEPALRG
jgi:hypothetical protein